VYKVIGAQHIFRPGSISTDSSVAYLGLIRSVLEQCATVVDMGCGRGSYADQRTQTGNLFDLRGPGRIVIGADVDPNARVNPFIDEFRHLDLADRWPFETASVDLVVSDWTLEHVQHPSAFVGEVTRVLHPGGVFIARSVNAHSVLAFISRLVPNDQHARVLSHAQPARRSVDVFPAHYRMNTSGTLSALLGEQYRYSLSYLRSYIRAKFPRVASVVAVVERHLPLRFQTAFVLCARLE
jgi:SAM-dependent methyltransferase